MALEPIDYTTHSREIDAEYLKIVRGSDADTTWLIISPNTKKEYEPESTGSSFHEFLQSFDDTKVQYGLARVSPPGSDVEKIIIIGWCPDSAPLKTRASFAANFATVANNLFKGYHVQVTARDEDDLDENELLMKISNAAGARYSIQTSSKQQGKTSTPPVKKSFTPSKAPAPVAEKVSAKVSSQASAAKVPSRSNTDDGDDDDWNEPELKERDFDQAPLKPNESSYKPIGKIDLRKVIAEEKSREDPRLVQKPTVAGSKIDPTSDIAHLKNESKLQRESEFNSFLGTTKTPSMVEPSLKNDNDKVIKGFRNEKSPAQLWAEKKAKKNGGSVETKTEKPQPKVPAGESDDEPDVKDLKSKFEEMAASEREEEEEEKKFAPPPRKSEPTIISPKSFSKPQEPTKSEEPQQSKPDYKKIGNPLPGMHVEADNEESQEEEEEDDDWDNDEEEAPQPPLPSRNAAPAPLKQEEEPDPEQEIEVPSLPSRNSIPPPREEAKTPEKEEEEEEEEVATPQLPSRNSAAPPPPPRRATPEEKPKENPWATAEYDYDAAEDNELTFVENDKIVNIEFVDDDWWLGELEKDGSKGLFPSNYVSLGN
ncbi:abp1p [Saccharomyces arboricola H-6]|uniref:Actin-binding protein n=1 Tax=Saccharomyces arboricola (strain H-6 / AS 2.3317 / CBS 10644) TaxID=1160507 RepID=J8QA68_SACAR|nr:abp1p [Saccharomyces arboricola H-6]